MLIRPMARRAIRKLRGLSADQRGVAAVEFALLLPIMVTLYFGGNEVATGVAADRKVTLVARTVADLASQTTKITTDDMTNLLNASGAVAHPFSSTNLKVVVSAVDIDADGKATIAWSATLNGTKRTKDDVVTSSVPEGLRVKGTQLIWGEVKYDYTPTIGYVITGTITLSDQMFMRPRLSETVIYPYTGT